MRIMTKPAQSVSAARVFARPEDGDIWSGPLQLAAMRVLRHPCSFKLLIGPPSCGKTALLAGLAHHHAATGVVLRASGPMRDARHLLVALLASAGLSGGVSVRETELRRLLIVLIEKRQFEQRYPLVVVDNAHQLRPSAWQELNRLHRENFRGAHTGTLLLAATGTPNPTWNPDARSVSVPMVHVLDYPTTRQLVAYLVWRLARFGMEHRFTPLALRLIAQLSAGRFRAANLLAQLAMIEQITTAAARIDVRVVQDAAARFASRRPVRAGATAPAVDSSTGDARAEGYNYPPSQAQSG
jgi:type II secretory pathway predicted ATPase ExeA